MIKGITVTLITQKEVGRDDFNAPIYEDVPEAVDNVLIGEPSTEAVVGELELYGKHIAYTLAIPKGDTHHWEDQIVEFFGERFKVYGHVTQGIDALIPLDWNKKVKVERYE
jgi:hypothetical protein